MPGEPQEEDLAGLFGAIDLDAALADATSEVLPLGDAPEPVTLDTSHLVELGRDLSTQYVDVVANYASEVFGSIQPQASRAQVDAALIHLRNLADATSDEALAERVRLLTATVEESVPRRHRARARYIKRLKAAIEGFGELLDGGGRTRLLRIVRYRVHGDPVLTFLQSIRGIGPKRLERLYLAGLNDLERLCEATPADVAAVTGLPIGLAERVVKESGEFAEAERKRALHLLSERADWLARSMRNLNPDDDEQQQLIRAAREAMTHLENMLQTLGAT